jgi:uncharacterized protein (TIGR01777 family)
MKVVIAGGSGLVGSAVTEAFGKKGFKVVVLTTSRKNNKTPLLEFVQWDPSKQIIPPETIEEGDIIINLAGFNVSNRWTEKNKREMITSRIDSTSTLVHLVNQKGIRLGAFIQASASGYYQPSQEILNEKSPRGNGFLSDLCEAWEKEASLLNNQRLAIIRIGVVMHQRDGALGRMMPFFKLGLGSAVGSGTQYMSWIHLDDLASLIVHIALNPTISGTFNASSPNPVTNMEFSKTLAKKLHRPFFLPPIPGFVMKLIFGEMASMLLNSQRLDASKITATGFEFRYSQIDEALAQIFQSA